jgi:hypothetical protein
MENKAVEIFEKALLSTSENCGGQMTFVHLIIHQESLI